MSQMINVFNRLFGILIISLSLLAGAIISQNSRTDGGDPPTMTVVLVIIVFVIGLALFFSGGGNKDNEAEYEYSNEEIEKELEEFNK
ncbi:hypothetical protein HMPREF1210_02363 [Paenisporosarcina sp. HGH0030]|uniref:hypothetical protein n=1 Tax=Paenisporosarcina sp. HGH0030 TaxID=1078085 RepID=UPI00034E01F7|nr:hypothetical protein [Paenisporosarcina sp. HGH0030]EPD50855.1 hypothetical protein HMPREF1210_02363 [Paenisporosarcina sp. HGH0030]